MRNSRNLVITGNSIHDCTVYGVRLESFVNGHKFSNNALRNNGIHWSIKPGMGLVAAVEGSFDDTVQAVNVDADQYARAYFSCAPYSKIKGVLVVSFRNNTNASASSRAFDIDLAGTAFAQTALGGATNGAAGNVSLSYDSGNNALEARVYHPNQAGITVEVSASFTGFILI